MLRGSVPHSKRLVDAVWWSRRPITKSHAMASANATPAVRGNTSRGMVFRPGLPAAGLIGASGPGLGEAEVEGLIEPGSYVRAFRHVGHKRANARGDGRCRRHARSHLVAVIERRGRRFTLQGITPEGGR